MSIVFLFVQGAHAELVSDEGPHEPGAGEGPHDDDESERATQVSNELASEETLSAPPSVPARGSDQRESAPEAVATDAKSADSSEEAAVAAVDAKNTEATAEGHGDTAEPAASQTKRSLFLDPKDGWFDMSYWVGDLHGFVPIPMIITEPALGGFGGALGLAFFGKKKPDDRIPPNIYGLGGGYTANESWFLGAFYLGFLDQGRLRVRAHGFYAQPNVNFYEQLSDGTEVSTLARIQSFGAGGSVLRKIGESPFYVGGTISDKQINLALTDIDFGQAFDLPDLDLQENQFLVNAEAQFDTRNNFFSPTNGTYLHLEGGYNRMSGERPSDFGNVSIAAHQFVDLRRVVLGFRAVTDFVLGDTPFYLRPYVSLRGVPIARYQGTFAFALETEEMIRFTDRIGMVVFGGWGKAISDQTNFRDATNVWNVGGGFRYLLARLYGLQMGFDVARGPEDLAWYIQFGHAWNGD